MVQLIEQEDCLRQNKKELINLVAFVFIRDGKKITKHDPWEQNNKNGERGNEGNHKNEIGKKKETSDITSEK